MLFRSMVVVSRVAVTTQVNADWVPPRSEMMRGSDEDTTLVARIETNIPSRMPDSASSTSRWVIFGLLLGTESSAVLVGSGAVVLVMVSLSVVLAGGSGGLEGVVGCGGQPDERGGQPVEGRGRAEQLGGRTESEADSVSRSEERRVGKECERLCRSRWSPYH